MGIVDRLLAEFELPSYGRCLVEADENGTVHLHLGTIRLEFSPREFEEFVAVVTAARSRLHEVKDLDHDSDTPDADERSDLGEESPLDAV